MDILDSALKKIENESSNITPITKAQIEALFTE